MTVPLIVPLQINQWADVEWGTNDRVLADHDRSRRANVAFEAAVELKTPSKWAISLKVTSLLRMVTDSPFG
ncbi:MAG: hypothetical protein NNA18_01955 [Nitrospira sp.]|nr:hypothetical protein [Nitrospira sp.]